MNGIFSRRYLERGDKDDQRPEYYVVVFKHINSDLEFTYKETKLMKAANLKKGIEYDIVTGELGNAVEVKWNKGRVYIKNNNSIIRVDDKGKEVNLSANTFKQQMRRMMAETNKKKK